MLKLFTLQLTACRYAPSGARQHVLAAGGRLVEVVLIRTVYVPVSAGRPPGKKPAAAELAPSSTVANSGDRRLWCMLHNQLASCHFVYIAIAV